MFFARVICSGPESRSPERISSGFHGLVGLCSPLFATVLVFARAQKWL